MIAVHLSIQAERRPAQTAVVFGQRRVSYGQLHERSNRFASGLAALGIVAGDRVAAMLHNGPAFLEALWGCAKLGAIYVPINFRLVAPEVGRIIDACTPRLLLAGTSFKELLDTLHGQPGFPAQVVWVDDGPQALLPTPTAAYEHWLLEQDAVEPATLPVTDAVLMLMHSSGTTGLPKGIIYTHATALASSTAKIIDFALSPSDTTVVFGPCFTLDR